VTERSSFEAFVDSVEEQLGPLDVLVNNAGIDASLAAVESTGAIIALVSAGSGSSPGV
jgi:NAD(P)-dependent dehydrogenase (short-subunit alcohol dehydrogenase family)